MPEIRIIVVRESLRESVASDVFTFMTLGGLVGLGILAQSAALQWIGGLFALAFIMGRVMALMYRRKRMTFDEARKEIDRLERKGAE